jgi:uncharacterized protein (TIGR00255 family)
MYMTRSMTAFARQESQHTWGSLVWELRSVNQRFLDPNIRIPDSVREIEPAMRDMLRKQLSRGKVDCTLRIEISNTQQGIQIDSERAAELISAAKQINALIEQPQPIDSLEILRWPGVMRDAIVNMDDVKISATSLFSATIDDLNKAREREGTELANLISLRLIAVKEVVTNVRAKMPEILSAQREQLMKRVTDLSLEIDSVRMEQEIALLASKADVAEELDRLDTHVAEVARILKQKGAIGRRLDFLMQELNREANTLSSKAIVVDTTNSAVELKVLIEQMREQIQNIE